MVWVTKFLTPQYSNHCEASATPYHQFLSATEHYCHLAGAELCCWVTALGKQLAASYCVTLGGLGMKAVTCWLWVWCCNHCTTTSCCMVITISLPFLVSTYVQWSRRSLSTLHMNTFISLSIFFGIIRKRRYYWPAYTV